jgi:hypothetical protein
MHYAFRDGFEKTAKKEDKKPGFGRTLMNTGVGLAAGAAAPTVLSTGFSLGALAASEKHNTADTDRVVATFKNTHPNNNLSVFRTGAPEAGASIGRRIRHGAAAFYNPESHSVVAPDKISFMAHELGHSTAPKYHAGAGGKAFWMTQGITRKLAPGMAALAPGVVGAAKGHENVQDIATYAPAAVAAPMVAEEARASLKGLNYIRKSHGMGKALRAAVPLGLAGASYAAIPVGSVLASRWMKNRVNNQDKK